MTDWIYTSSWGISEKIQFPQKWRRQVLLTGVGEHSQVQAVQGMDFIKHFLAIMSHPFVFTLDSGLWPHFPHLCLCPKQLQTATTQKHLSHAIANFLPPFLGFPVDKAWSTKRTSQGTHKSTIQKFRRFHVPWGQDLTDWERELSEWILLHLSPFPPPQQLILTMRLRWGGIPDHLPITTITTLHSLSCCLSLWAPDNYSNYSRTQWYLTFTDRYAPPTKAPQARED